MTCNLQHGPCRVGMHVRNMQMHVKWAIPTRMRCNHGAYVVRRASELQSDASDAQAAAGQLHGGSQKDGSMQHMDAPSAHASGQDQHVERRMSSRQASSSTGDGTPAWRPRSIHRWPRSKILTERPAFLENYPAPPGKTFNINSFFGLGDPHKGKYFVPPQQYNKFLQQYYKAFVSGYMMFLTEAYQNSPYRYFVELDFDWEVDQQLVLRTLSPVLQIVQETVAQQFKLKQLPNYLISMRTPWKVHLNFASVITTELLANLVRDVIIERCRTELPSKVPGAETLDWERIVDFPHGSFRMLGSRKTKKLDKDPEWVGDKAYYPVTLALDGVTWIPQMITLSHIQLASIVPTSAEVKAFESSPAYLDLIYKDMKVYQSKLDERIKKRATELVGGGKVGSAPTSPTSPIISVDDALRLVYGASYSSNGDSSQTGTPSSSSSGSGSSGSSRGSKDMAPIGGVAMGPVSQSQGTETPKPGRLLNVKLRPNLDGGVKMSIKYSRLADQQDGEQESEQAAGWPGEAVGGAAGGSGVESGHANTEDGESGGSLVGGPGQSGKQQKRTKGVSMKRTARFLSLELLVQLAETVRGPIGTAFLKSKKRLDEMTTAMSTAQRVCSVAQSQLCAAQRVQLGITGAAVQQGGVAQGTVVEAGSMEASSTEASTVQGHQSMLPCAAPPGSSSSSPKSTAPSSTAALGTQAAQVPGIHAMPQAVVRQQDKGQTAGDTGGSSEGKMTLEALVAQNMQYEAAAKQLQAAVAALNPSTHVAGADLVMACLRALGPASVDQLGLDVIQGLVKQGLLKEQPRVPLEGTSPASGAAATKEGSEDLDAATVQASGAGSGEAVGIGAAQGGSVGGGLSTAASASQSQAAAQPQPMSQPPGAAQPAAAQPVVAQPAAGAETRGSKAVAPSLTLTPEQQEHVIDLLVQLGSLGALI